MQKVKDFLSNIAQTLGKLLFIVILVFMLGIMSVWTVGMFYVASEAGCKVQEQELVCGIGK